MAKAAKKKPGKITLSLDAKAVMDGISRLDRLKRHMKGRRRLQIEMNIHELNRIADPIRKAVEGVSKERAIKDPSGEPVQNFIPIRKNPDMRLDFSRYDGQWKEGEYAPGRIVMFSNAFYEAEDVTSERPPSDTWAHIGDGGNGHFLEDPVAWRKEVQEIELETHDMELYTIPASLYDEHDIDECWLEITDMGE